MRIPWIAVVLATACEQTAPSPGNVGSGTPHVAPSFAPAPVPVPVPPPPARRPRGPGSGGARTPIARVFAAADAAPGKRTSKKTAVILVAPARSAWNDTDEDVELARFVPIVCAIDGVIATGKPCGEAMPARATIRVPTGTIEIARSAKPFHDNAGEHDYPAPYGPECCMYNTCVGTTVPFTAVRMKSTSGAHTMFGVWPADADVGLEVAGAGTGGISAAALATPATQEPVTQAFARGNRRYSARGAGGIWWDLGAGWTHSNLETAGNGQVLLATSDVDHDGTLELISYQLWANDYGIDVSNATLDPLYEFSCGNI